MGIPLPLTPEQTLIKSIRSLFNSHLQTQDPQNINSSNFDDFASSINEEDPVVKHQFEVIFQEYHRRKNSVTIPLEVPSTGSTLTNVLQNFRRRHSTVSENEPRSLLRTNSSAFIQLPRAETVDYEIYPNFFSPLTGSTLPPIFQSPLFSNDPPRSNESFYSHSQSSQPQVFDPSFNVSNTSLPRLAFNPVAEEPSRMVPQRAPYQNSYSNNSNNSNTEPESSLRNEAYPRNIRLNRSNAFLHSAINRSNPYTSDHFSSEVRLRRNSESVNNPDYSVSRSSDFPSVSLASPSSSITLPRNTFFPFDHHQ